MSAEHADALIIGGGFFGLYLANRLLRRGARVTLVEGDATCASRASSINQARVHRGYHYPRSVITARSSIRFYQRFVDDFAPAINASFRAVYAVSNRNSFTPGRQFETFCDACAIPLRRIDPRTLFTAGSVEAAYETDEASFDGRILGDLLLTQNRACAGFDLRCATVPTAIERASDRYLVRLDDGRSVTAPAVINATYSGINRILALLGEPTLRVKYEMCEVILVQPAPPLRDVGITVMDGPFFSLMPFGRQPLHSLTAVDFTPHRESGEALPTFPCQRRNPACAPERLQNCNPCPARPTTAFTYMAQLARRYLAAELAFDYAHSLFAVKTVLRASEVDDSRPTLIHRASERPLFATVLSGKINTMYELDELADGIAA